jgi:outer membrane protein OmpA-like peptidoglycan-associated protein
MCRQYFPSHTQATCADRSRSINTSTMRQRVGKCTNFSSCKLAYRNEQITTVTKDFRCPECGLPLEPVSPKKQTPYLLYTSAGVGAVLLLAIGAILWTFKWDHSLVSVVQAPPSATPEPLFSTPLPTATPEFFPSAPPLAVTPPSPQPSPPPSVTPLPLPQPPADPNNVRATVLKRIEQMPHLQEATKDKLRDAVMQAKDLDLLLTVPFDTARAILTFQDLASIKDQLVQPKNSESLRDQTLVLVVLGFADTRGADVKSYDLSGDRAQSVMTALRDQCGLRNEMHAVPMGGTAIFDQRDYAKNRVVEVWSGKP